MKLIYHHVKKECENKPFVFVFQLQFEEYVSKWVKIQQEAKGWPSWVGNDVLKQHQYIQEVYKREGLRLSHSNIKNNPALYTKAKIRLKYVWESNPTIRPWQCYSGEGKNYPKKEDMAKEA